MLTISITNLRHLLIFVVALRVASGQFPAPFNPAKVWWAKRITPKFFTAGRLSERQLKYAVETGFKSIVSLMNSNEPAWIGHEYLPGNREIEQMARNVLGVKFLVGDKRDYPTVSDIDEFTEAAKGLPKPVLIFCKDSYLSTLTVLLQLARSKKLASKGKTQTEEFFRIGKAMGYEFDTNERVVSLVASVTGEPPVALKTKSPGNLSDWRQYWPAKHVSSTFFDAGQILRTDVPQVKKAGFKAVINMRQGKTSVESGNPTQEEVTLLNIPCYTETYYKGQRQFFLRLLESRRDPSKSNDYISPVSPLNFEVQNENEFGDDVGYNEELERQAFEEAGIPYFHIPAPYPCGHEGTEIFHANKDKLMEIAKKYGKVLMHCKIGYRTGFFSLLMETYVSCKDYDWLIGQAHVIGYDFDSEYTALDKLALQDALKKPGAHCINYE